MKKRCWNCGEESISPEENWCANCGRIQDEEIPIVLTEGNDIKVVNAPALFGLGIELSNGKIVIPGPKGIRITLRRKE